MLGRPQLPGGLAHGGAGALPSIASVAAITAALGWLLNHQADWEARHVVASLIGYTVLAAIVALAARRLIAFGLANQVTLLRAGLVCLVGGALLGSGGAAYMGWSLPILAAVALVLDALDGWIARRLALVSDFGARFDVEIDSLLLIILALLVWQSGKVGAWVLMLGLLRYGFVVVGWWLSWLRRPLPASQRRKGVCAFQGATMLVCLLPPVGAVLANLGAAVALSALVASFAVDIAWLYRHAHRAVLSSARVS